MQKRLRIMLFGAFLLCVLVGGIFAFSHIGVPAHASSYPFGLGASDGRSDCLNHTDYYDQDASSFSGADHITYDRAWGQAYLRAGCTH